jgi:ATP-dependent RNA helicase RhlE
MLRDIEKVIKQKIPQEIIAGFEPDPHAVAQPIQLRSQQHQQSRKPKAAGGGGGRAPAKRSSPPKRSFNR